jgi:prepilin-type N-terminal cleavage/methylation domain-containing protein
MSSKLKKRAFTLVELLVAVAITALIVVLLGTMFGSVANTTSHAHERTDAFREARAALQMMARDFSTLVRTQWEPDPFAVPAPATAPVPKTRPVAYLALKNIYNDPISSNQQLYGLIAAKNASTGDVCSVGYYSSWDGSAYSLRRYFRDSSATYTALSSQATYASDAVMFKPNPATNPADEVLAQYVWNLKITPYDAAGIALTYPYVCDASATSATKPPVALDISFSAISSQAARTVMSVTRDPNDWTNTSATNYQRLIRPYVYQFHMRVAL